MLREEDPPVRDDVELPRRAGDGRGRDAELLRDLGRETRGARVVAASGRAVVDLHRHGFEDYPPVESAL